jgi:DNA-binding transcriptional ArsR family regulator
MVTEHRDIDRSVFDAIADPTRRAILDVVRERETGAGELAARFEISRPAIARHVRILRQAGLLLIRKDAQRRYYSLRPGALAEVDRWLEPYRVFWSARLVDLKRYVEDDIERDASGQGDKL